jgi:hypothetical protein
VPVSIPLDWLIVLLRVQAWLVAVRHPSIRCASMGGMLSPYLLICIAAGEDCYTWDRSTSYVPLGPLAVAAICPGRCNKQPATAACCHTTEPAYITS